MPVRARVRSQMPPNAALRKRSRNMHEMILVTFAQVAARIRRGPRTIPGGVSGLWSGYWPHAPGLAHEAVLIMELNAVGLRRPNLVRPRPGNARIKTSGRV